jgi:hypothetical protein
LANHKASFPSLSLCDTLKEQIHNPSRSCERRRT